MKKVVILRSKIFEMKKIFSIVIACVVIAGLSSCKKKDKTTNESINGFEIQWNSDFNIKADRDVVRDAIRDLVYVEGGTFMMGDELDEAFENERPVHNVTVSSFYIGKTEVTQALWSAVMGTRGGDDSYQEWESTYGLGDKYPAYRVSYSDAVSFINKLYNITGLSFALPTEAQWEYAARGGKSTTYKKYAGSDKYENVAVTNENYSKCSVVASKSANELGLYDMSGNVWEICRDWYEDYVETPDSTSVQDPEGINYGSGHKVFRGGSWNNPARYARVTTRYKQGIHYQDKQTGFRLVIKR